MKNILLILLTIITFNCYSQVIVEIPEDELEEVFLAIDTLKQQDEVKSILIFDLESQIRNYEMLSKQDSMILDYRLQQVKLLNEQIKLYDDRLRKVDKWDKKPCRYLPGCFSIYFVVQEDSYTVLHSSGPCPLQVFSIGL